MHEHHSPATVETVDVVGWFPRAEWRVGLADGCLVWLPITDPRPLVGEVYDPTA
jgi:hypothetical protein